MHGFLYVMFKTRTAVFLSGLKRKAIAKCFRPDKTRAASFLDGFQNEPFDEFIGEVALQMNLI